MAVAGHSPRFLWHCGVFILDHCKQQQAALDFFSEELVISQVISHVYNMYTAV